MCRTLYRCILPHIWITLPDLSMPEKAAFHIAGALAPSQSLPSAQSKRFTNTQHSSAFPDSKMVFQEAPIVRPCVHPHWANHKAARQPCKGPKQPEMHCKSLRLLLSPETRAIAGTNLSWCIVFKSSQHIMLLHVHLSTTLCFLHNNLQLLWQSSVSHLENALSHLLARRMRSYEHQTSNMKSVIFALYLCFGWIMNVQELRYWNSKLPIQTWHNARFSTRERFYR